MSTIDCVIAVFGDREGACRGSFLMHDAKSDM